MTNITASVVSQTISATVSASGGIVANVGSGSITASASGGMGPQGPAGTSGGPIEQLSNVAISGAADGDVLQFVGVDNKWHNTPILDGGNF